MYGLNVSYFSYRFHNEDGSCCHSLACAPSLASATSNYLAIGSESGVVSIYDEILDVEKISKNTTFTTPQSIRSIMNVTTNITSLKFHPSSQVLAIASDEVRSYLL